MDSNPVENNSNIIFDIISRSKNIKQKLIKKKSKLKKKKKHVGPLPRTPCVVWKKGEDVLFAIQERST